MLSKTASAPFSTGIVDTLRSREDHSKPRRPPASLFAEALNRCVDKRMLRLPLNMTNLLAG